MTKLFQRSAAMREFVSARRDQDTREFLDRFDQAVRHSVPRR